MDSQPSANTHELLERHRAGDPAALETLVRRYYPRIERMVRVRVGPALLARETVADVVQDVLVRIVQSIDSYAPREDARWIDFVARLAENEIRNHARRDRALKRGGPLARKVRAYADSASSWSVAAETTGVPAKAARAEEAELLDRCLAELDEAHREVILLRNFAGSDWRTVAEQMGRPTGEACQELHRRARRELGKRLQARR